MNHTEILALMVDDNEARRQIIQNWMMDEKEKFEERKEIWLATPRHLYSTKSYIIHLPEFEKKYGKISWYDDFYAEKDSVVDLVDVCRDVQGEYDGVTDEWDHDFFKSQEMLDDFIRTCLKLGYHSFTYDW